ncbi:hypothetical protein CEXT_149981 [Caerostris extrusa]|uniref:Uncharacterized protein n=1 Tax=Caerostris extrusa TaxID=172846 RepID=A0AAV4SY22_CAEEX|nr:hypothetical protein CEXT_149981 [Caerostris extrusa]
MSGHVIFENSNDPNLEMLAVEIQSHNVTLTIVNIYAPHGFDIHQVQKFFSTLKSELLFLVISTYTTPFGAEKHLRPKAKNFVLVESVAFFYPEYLNAHSHHT